MEDWMLGAGGQTDTATYWVRVRGGGCVCVCVCQCTPHWSSSKTEPCRLWLQPDPPQYESATIPGSAGHDKHAPVADRQRSTKVMHPNLQ